MDHQRAGLEKATGESQKAATVVPNLNRVPVDLLEWTTRDADSLTQSLVPAARAARRQQLPQGILVKEGQLLL
jgi:hypothetical protein